MKAFSIKDVGEAYEKGYIAGQADLLKILKSDGQPEIAKVVEQYVDVETLESLGEKPLSSVNVVKISESPTHRPATDTSPRPKKCVKCGYDEPTCRHEGKSYSCPTCKAARERFRSKNDEVVK